MNNTEQEVYLWLIISLFWLGVLLIPVGLALVFVPAKTLKISHSINRWISTQGFFDVLNRPRYQEAFFYRYHRLFGIIVMISSALSFYMMTFYAGIGKIKEVLIRLAETEFSRWLLINLYYIGIALFVLVFIMGIVIFIRPSILKPLETWGNRWVPTDEAMQKLDEVHEIPEHILPGKPRLFGILVIIAAVYIMFNTSAVVFTG